MVKVNLERKYCGCIMKVRAKSPINPYGICTKSVYGSRNKKRTKRVNCLSRFNLTKLTHRTLKSIAKEKRIKTDLRSKNKIIKELNKYLKRRK
jgi:hypothetical protein